MTKALEGISVAIEKNSEGHIRSYAAIGEKIDELILSGDFDNLSKLSSAQSTLQQDYLARQDKLVQKAQKLSQKD